MRYRTLSVAAVALGWIGTVQAAVTEIKWDLGITPSATIEAPPGTYQLVVESWLASGYRIAIQKERTQVPPLVLATDVKDGWKAAAAPAPGSTDKEAKFAPPPPPACEVEKKNKVLKPLIEGVRASFSAATNEAQFAQLRDELRFELKRAGNDCPAGNFASEDQALEHMVHQSRKALSEQSLVPGDKLTVTLTRGTAPNERSFTYTVSTPAAGHFAALFTIAALPNRDKEYFVREDGSGQFAITRRRSGGGLTPTFAVMYPFIKSGDAMTGLSHGLSLGLGVDKNNLLVLGGYTLTYHERVGFSIGVALHEQKRLNGEFTEGQVVAEALTSDALERKVFRVNGFAGFHFKFD